MKNFTEYLQDIFMEDYHGTKDQCEDAFDGWLANLDTEELIDYADLFAEGKVAEFTRNNIKQ